MLCLLCESPRTGQIDFLKESKTYHACGDCGFRFLDPRHRLESVEEKARYALHVNDPTQKGYREYCAPLVTEISAAHSHEDKGLDYGAGPDSATYRMLLEEGFTNIIRYDRFFLPDEAALAPANYDFIYACEVVEHFHEPRVEFSRLQTLLRPGGTLAFMTSLHTPSIDFENWHYRRDPTHVSFFSAPAITNLARDLGFENPKIIGSRTVSMRRSLP